MFDYVWEIYVNLAFPETHDFPPDAREIAEVFSVTFLVSRKLLLPEFSICLRGFVVTGAPVPEAAINKDCQSRLQETNIRTSIGYMVVLSVAHSALP